MNILYQEQKEKNIINKNLLNKTNNNTTNKLSKYFRGIWIYLKDYVLFLKGSTIKVIKIINYTTYHWGFQMILLIGATQSFGVVNIMAQQFAPHLVKEGEIE